MVTDSPNTTTAPVAPRTTSLNEPDFRAADVASGALAVTESAQAVAPGSDRASPEAAPRHSGMLRESAAKYQLIMPPTYENIVGGAPPSPIVSLFLVVGVLALLGAALLSGINLGGAEWWIFGVLFVVVATTLAGFISRTAD
ncbi:MAG TPA: hypothetical protein VFX49_02905 [Chloroflexota bacterium]|nr:hypothetical protein [Chloroflexota bacterium]